MNRRCTSIAAATLLLATAGFATACNENAVGPLTAPLKSPPNPALLITTTTNVWDFVALIGGNNGDGGRGNTHTFTIPGAGSIVATLDPAPYELYRKGYFDPPGTEERGLGICLDPGTGCVSPGDSEIGDVWPDGTMPAIVLDLTGLSAGTTISQATLASLQETEGWRVLSSVDGVNYNLLTEGTGSAATLPTLTFPVPSETKFLRFEALPCGTNAFQANSFGGDNGGEEDGACAGNNYLLQSVTTSTETNTGGKDFSIGPSSMEGAIKITTGDWVNGGYSFKFASGTHIATQFTVDAFVTISGPCSNGGTDAVTVPLGSKTYSVSANNTDWLPTGDANNVLSWQGSVKASVCGGVGLLNASKGAVYHATVSQNPATGSLVNFRFKFRDPAAKGKPNTNCLDTSDPNRAKADVCGASWSQTVKDP